VLSRTPFPLAYVAGTVALISLHADRAGVKIGSSEADRSDVRFSAPGERSNTLLRHSPPPECDGVLAVERRYVDDMKAKNMDDVLSLYAPGAVFIQPDSTQVIGREALEKLYRTVFATYDSDLSLGDSDVRPVGSSSSLCVHSGEYGERLRTRKDGTIAHIRGMVSFTYKRMKDGHWLITRMRWGPAM
jgi:ketosteroid isomerase-like protein